MKVSITLKTVRQTLVSYFGDVRIIGLVVFGVIVVLVSWSGVKAIQTNYDLQKRIAVLGQQNDVKKLENENQKLKNAYLQTDQYLELAARKQFGLAAAGETVWLIPKSTALAAIADLPPPPEEADEASVTSQSEEQKNFQEWLDFFLHRNRETIDQ